MSADFWTFDDFAFTKEELMMLISIQYWAVRDEISQSKPGFGFSVNSSNSQEKVDITAEYRSKKRDWLNDWYELVSSEIPYLHQKHFLVDEFKKCDLSAKKKIIFIAELSIFYPYGNITIDRNYDDIKFNKDDENVYTAFCSSFFDNSDIFDEYRDIFARSAKKLAKASSGTNWAIIGAGVGAFVLLIAAPYLGAMVGGLMGLSGAAATSAGLAALGGGSLATTGFGMAGGYAAVMAGGAILGYGTGGTHFKSKIIQMSQEELLISCAKVISVMQVSKATQEDKRKVCNKVRLQQFDFERQVDKFMLNNQEDEAKKAKAKANILENTIKILRGEI